MLELEPEWEEFPEFLKVNNQSFEDVVNEMRDFERRMSVRRKEPSKPPGKRSGESLTVISNPGKSQSSGN